MEEAAIATLISTMNSQWFKKQASRFKEEQYYNDHLNKIYIELPYNEYSDVGEILHSDKEIIDVDFIDYCWDSDFSYSQKQLFLCVNNGFEHWYNDGIDIVRNIILEINDYISKFTDIEAIDSCINEANSIILNTIANLKRSNPEADYYKYLDLFVLKQNEIFVSTYAHVQIQKTILQKRKIGQHLTYEICQYISEFNIKNKRLITSVVPAEQDNAQVLLFLLTNTGEIKPKTRILIEDWAVQDFYYLLFLIMEYFSNISTISQIEKNKGFQLKTEKFFASNSFYKFKSDNLIAYIDRNQSHSLINDLMRQYKR